MIMRHMLGTMRESVNNIFRQESTLLIVMKRFVRLYANNPAAFAVRTGTLSRDIFSTSITNVSKQWEALLTNASREAQAM
mmetsp:Transcript_18726/g.26549  ORF Transcript_18726/g.26549 Transcript_18726/m.26549 type:complete len:80 (+) Transcript_18726:627-866(+)